jgi:hypothetical protein
MPVGRKVVLPWHSEKHVCVRFARIAVEYRDLTPRREELGTRAPVELGVSGATSKCALARRLFGER